ncbi:MAG: chitobiase/beta-hexosaminidase C-terminal domain-containing protein, partial [Planctomycetota bacterium]
APDAAVYYTLDGSEPTRRSPRYTEPFVLERAATVRARAFTEKGHDPEGAAAQFLPPPEPIVEDFEEVPVGAVTPGATTQEDPEKTEYTARVSDEQAAGGAHSLKFTDGPGQQHAFSPHVYYRCRFVEGRLVGRFDVRMGRDAQLRYQWRRYEGSRYRIGPSVLIEPDGKVSSQGKTLLTIPVEQWVRLEVSCVLGAEGKPAFDLSVWLPGAPEPQVFPALPHAADFERLDWVGLVANGQREAAFYVDNVEIRPVE